jgi:transposase InsO family protein
MDLDVTGKICTKHDPLFRGMRENPLGVEPGSPWENGYCESFNGKLRDEFLNGEICSRRFRFVARFH